LVVVQDLHELGADHPLLIRQMGSGAGSDIARGADVEDAV
jgi:hypothetical protein